MGAPRIDTRLHRWSSLAVVTVLGLGSVGVGGVADAAPVSKSALVDDPASYANTFIGTAHDGDDFPGADSPFGMVQWSPDTPSRPDGGGYGYDDSAISGFSLTHLSGPGCAAAGDVPILPTVGAVDYRATDSFSHAEESASPGYYEVRTGNGVTTELTTTTRSGMARFTFPSVREADLVFKLADSADGDFADRFNVVSDFEVSGSVTSGHFCGMHNTYTVYFDMLFNRPFTAAGTNAAPSSHTLKDGYVTFDTTGNQVVQAKVGISYVSIANAVRNRSVENPNWNINATRAAAARAWNARLGKIRIAGGTAAQDAVFYTALYHALLHPNVISDLNGEYPGFNGKVAKVDAGHDAVYANYSGWDAYRSQAQLEALIDPRAASDTAESMLDDYAQTGRLPKWSEDNGETYIMVGDPAASILADYYAFGARDFHVHQALKDMIAEATTTNDVRPGNNYLYGSDALGYIPADGMHKCCDFYAPVSTQLEYDAADYSIASLAKSLGDTSEYTKFAALAQSWQNVFDPASGFMRPRLTSGAWPAGFDPSRDTGFAEGTAWVYTGMVDFNIAGLAAAYGGDADYNSGYLDKVLAGFDGGTGDEADFGNEPSLELPWEYDYTGQPYKTQHVIREIQDRIWTDSPGGLAGNDDLGEMSAWYVWSALGLFPEASGNPNLALGSPLFPKAVIALSDGRTLTIRGNGATAAAPYVQSATWNGSPWNDAYAPSTALTHGGTLSFKLATMANTAWASLPQEAAPSDPTGESAVVAATSPGSGLILTPGASADAKLVAANLTDKPMTVSWSTSSRGATISPSASTFTIPARSRASTTLHVTGSQIEGAYEVPITLKDGGTRLRPAVLDVDVLKPGALWPYYTNSGISADGSGDDSSDGADYDGVDYSYSANALAAHGITPGGKVTSDGVTYTWPNVAPGALDNVEAEGQTIPLGPITATKIGLLGSATDGGSNGATGALTVTYTDGTTQAIPVVLGDWTHDPGPGPTSTRDTVVAKIPYRDFGGGDSTQTIDTYLLSFTSGLETGKTVRSVTLPTPRTGDIHIFALGFEQQNGERAPSEQGAEAAGATSGRAAPAV